MQADIHRDDQQQDRQQERNPPAPRFEGFSTEDGAAGEDNQQRKKQAEGRGGLNPRGEETAPAFRCMFGHIGCRTAVFTAQGQTLQQAQGDQDDWRRHANGRVTGQEAHHRCGNTHDHNRDEEGVFAPDHVAQPTEHNRSEWPHGKACGEGEQGKDKGRGLVDAGEEVLGDDRREGAVEVKVVPLEHGAQGRGEDDLALLLGNPVVGCAARGCVVDCRHEFSPLFLF
ncbi:hypothetical protein D3C72_924950 [compost metagenome]